MDSLNCPFQWTFNTKLSYFDHIQRNPETLNDFNIFMSGIRSTRIHWTEWFPVETQILSGFSGADDGILMVDVGGGKGHDLERLLKQFPNIKGRLILQDLPATISNVKELSAGIQAMPHDFFTPQPVSSK